MEHVIEAEESVKLDALRANDDGVETDTSDEQKRVEESIAKFYRMVEKKNPKLLRKEHVHFLLTGVKGLGSGYQSLDASRPWLCYWILHSLELLNSFLAVPENPIVDRVVSFLSHCQSPYGGFGGGPNQLPHLAPTYAAVNSLMICGTEKAFTSINRETMYKFLLSLKNKNNGSFSMHKDGETDVRATYCALSVAKLLNLLTPELISGAAEFVGKCQTYEGGMGGFPGNEAHGGYTFCGFAALILLNRFDVVDLPLLIEWAVKRQMPFEGGFQGRTNKLVDACYSFWQGGIFPLIDMAVNNQVEAVKPPEELELSEEDGSWLFVQNNLQQYLFMCCQEPAGGFRDKPGKSRDYYHTCYALSGLSVSQYNKDGTATIYGGEEDNLVAATHPVHNIGFDKVERAIKYFSVK